MGLDLSHGCWNGPYGAFGAWRKAIAKAAGLPPLGLMEGFYNRDDFFFHPSPGRIQKFPIAIGSGGSGWSYAAEEALSALPIRWDAFRGDPLTKLLNHSDCDGELKADDCGPIAARLAELIPKLTVAENWRKTTRKFISGLLKASAAGENVTFR